jgi:hypothetical protein
MLGKARDATCPQCLAWALDVTTCAQRLPKNTMEIALFILYTTTDMCVCVLCSAYYYNYPELKKKTKKAKEWESGHSWKKVQPPLPPKRRRVVVGNLWGTACHWWRVAKSLTGKCWLSFVSNVYSGLQAAVVKSTKDFSEKSNRKFVMQEWLCVFTHNMLKLTQRH